MFPSEQIIDMIGDLDNTTDNATLGISPHVALQGVGSLERTLNYLRHLGRVFGEGIYRRQHIGIVLGTGHESERGLASAGGRYWIFDHGEPAPGPTDRHLARLPNGGGDEATVSP